MIVGTREKWRERLRSPLTWHLAGVAVLAIAVLALAVRLGFAWSYTDANASRILAGKKAQIETLAADTVPLRGLEKRVAATRGRIANFYMDRIPESYSHVATRMSELEVRSGARLSHLQYTQGTPGVDLTEISMDASITGEYPQIMHFVNGLERDNLFFVIRGLSLNGQQGGLVNLRLRVSTWLHSADAEASGLPKTPARAAASASSGREGQ